MNVFKVPIVPQTPNETTGKFTSLPLKAYEFPNTSLEEDIEIHQVPRLNSSLVQERQTTSKADAFRNFNNRRQTPKSIDLADYLNFATGLDNKQVKKKYSMQQQRKTKSSQVS